MDTKKVSTKTQVRTLFSVSPGHVVNLGQLRKVTGKYTQRISDLRKDGMVIECIDKRKGIYKMVGV